MTDFSKTRFGQMANNPAAPLGLQQSANRFATGLDSSWKPKSSMLETAATWYTGANSEGIENGWDSQFYRTAYEQLDRYSQAVGESGDPRDFYKWLEDPNATGVAMWDDEERGIRFGDVFNAGVKQQGQNLYDTFDKQTADVMMAEFMFDKDTKSRLFARSDREQAIADAVDERHASENERRKYAETSGQFGEDVKAREEWLREHEAQYGLALGSAVVTGATAATLTAAAGAAATAAGLTAWSGPGALVAGGVAAAVAGITAWMNQDQLVEMTARAWEVTSRSNEKYNGVQGLAGTAGTASEEWSKVVTQLAKPGSNLVQGITDSYHGERGDMDAEFQEFDADGNRVAGKLAIGLDIVASVGDSALQFSSPVGRWIYFGTLGSGVGGKTTSMLATDEGWNDRTGTFDSYDGWKEHMAAAGSIGIDVLQMGIAAKLGSAAAASRSAFGAPPIKEGGRFSKYFKKGDEEIPGVLRPGQDIRINGIQFSYNEAGERTAKMTAEALVPSEFMRWVPTLWVARMNKVDKGALSGDDIYNAAVTMTRNGSRVRDALINGYAEAAEEGVQAILDPMSQSADISWTGELPTAMLYGFAGGAGMSLGSINQRATRAQIEENQARYLYSHRTGIDPTPEQWGQIWGDATPAERDQMRLANEQEARQIKVAIDALTDMHRADMAGRNPLGLAALRERNHVTRYEKLQREAQKSGSMVLLPWTGNTITLPGSTLEDIEFGPEAVVVSAAEFVNQYHQSFQGLGAQAESVQDEINKIDTEIKQLGQAIEADRLAHLTDLKDRLRAEAKALRTRTKIASQLVDWVDGYWELLRNETDEAAVKSLIDQMNDKARKAFHGELTDTEGNALPDDLKMDIMRAGEILYVRDPQMDPGSYVRQVPQISLGLTRLDANNVGYVHQSVIKAPGGDFDGDTRRALHDLYLPNEEWIKLQQGAQYFETTKDDDGKTLYKLNTAAPDDESTYMYRFSSAMRAPGDQMNAVTSGLSRLKGDLRRMLVKSNGGPIKDADFDAAWKEFHKQVKAGIPTARMDLFTTLFNLDPQGMLARADVLPSPVIPWMMSRANFAFDSIDRELGHIEALNPVSILLEDPGDEPPDSNILRDNSLRRARNAAHTLAMLPRIGAEATRPEQHLHYDVFYRTLTQVEGLQEGQFTDPRQEELVALYANIGSGATESDVDQLWGRNSVEDRVIVWLKRIAERATAEGKGRTPAELMMLLAQIRVPDISFDPEFREYRMGYGEISLLQLLLRRSIDIEKGRLANAREDDAKAIKIQRLERLTKAEGKRSTTASLALLEVFDAMPMGELVGEDSQYIGPQMTIGQFMKMLLGDSKINRDAKIHALVHRSPAYMRHTGELKNPPWGLEVLADGQINAYTMLMDAVKVGVDSWGPRYEGLDKTKHDEFKTALGSLHQEMDSWWAIHSERLTKEDKTSQLDILRDLLEHRPNVATSIVKIIPENAFRAVFATDGSQLYPNKWLEAMLTERDKERAAKLFFIHTKFATYNAAGGRLGFDDEENSAGTVKFEDLDSRFLQLVHMLAREPGGLQLTRLLKTLEEAPTLYEMIDRINEDPVWSKDRAPLLPYYDDVSMYRPTPKDLWNPASTGADLREAISTWANQMTVNARIEREAEINDDLNAETVESMRFALEHPDQASANDKYLLGQLKLALKNKAQFPDSIGQAIRTQALQAVQHGLIVTHNKGVADERIEPLGSPRITMDTLDGYTDSVRAEINAWTARDAADVMTNPTKIVEGVVIMQQPDGSILTIDMTDSPAGLKNTLDMLADPGLRGFAMQVIGDTVRDVNNANVVQSYMDTDSEGNLAEILREQNYVHLFEKREGTQAVQQAHRLIGKLESYVRRKLATASAAEQEESYSPLQQGLQEMLVAYSHAPEARRPGSTAEINRMLRDVHEALIQIAALPPELHDKVKNRVRLELLKRQKMDTFLEQLLDMPDWQQDVFLASWRDQMTEIWLKKWTQLTADIQAESDPAKKQELMDSATKAKDVHTALTQGELVDIFSKLAIADNTVPAVLNQYTLVDEKGDPKAKKANEYRKLQMLQFLAHGNNMIGFRAGENPVLIEKIETVLARQPSQWMKLSEEVSTKEWAELGSWCAARQIMNTSVRASSEYSLHPMMLGDEGANVQRYFDTTWSSLMDPLFNPHILEGMRILLTNAGNPVETDDEKVAETLLNGIFNERNLGEWSPIVVTENLKYNKAMRGATVGAALSQEGVDPVEMADYVGSSIVSSKPPESQHFSNKTIAVMSGELLEDVVLNNPSDWMVLHNHFASRVTVTPNDPSIVMPPNVLDNIGLDNNYAESAGVPQLKVLDLNRLQSFLSTYDLSAGYTVEIDYVDVRKLPAERDWANNLFFEGVGRDAMTGSGIGAVAALWFGVGALSKMGQQNPLDAAAKKGKAFRAYQTSTYQERENLLNRVGTSVTEILLAKTGEIIRRGYDFGQLSEDDVPSIFKLLKMRHIIVGKDADGNRVVWWPEHALAIEAENQGTIPDLVEWKLVELSDSVAQTLRGGSGRQGLDGVITDTQLNISRMDRWPKLTESHLESLGLDRLGEDADIRDSILTYYSPLPRAIVTQDRGADQRNKFQMRREAWQVNSNEITGNRWAQQRDKMVEQRQRNTHILNQALRPDENGRMLDEFGVPQSTLVDVNRLKATFRTAASVSKFLHSDANTIWIHQQDAQASGYDKGVLVQSDLLNPSTQMKKYGPTYGDAVFIDLSSILRANGGNYEAAYDQAKKIFNEYAQRGLMIILGGDNGDYRIRQGVDSWARYESGLDFKPMSNSFVYMPMEESELEGSTRQALSATLTAVNAIGTRGLDLQLVGSFGSYVSENALVIDTDHNQSYKHAAAMILPSALTYTGDIGDRQQFAFGLPQAGPGAADQRAYVIQKLKALLSTDEGMDFLEEMSKGDPDVRLYEKNKNGTEYGVLPIKQALLDLRNTLNSGKLPTDRGETLMTGSLVPVIAGDSIMLVRVGFKPPSIRELGDMLESAIGDGLPQNVAIFHKEQDKNHSVAPRFTVRGTAMDDRGRFVYGDYDQNAMAKIINQGTGYKGGATPMPNNLRFPDRDVAANGLRITALAGLKSVAGKQALFGAVDNFRWGFALTGIDFQNTLLDVFYGETRDPKESTKMWNELKKQLDQWSRTQHQFSASELQEMMSSDEFLLQMGSHFNAIAATVNPSFTAADVTLPKADMDPKQLLTMYFMTSLAAPGVTLQHLIRTPGLMTVQDRDAGTQIQLMPALFTDALASYNTPQLRNMLIGMMNGRLAKLGNSANGDPVYWFDENLNMHVRMFDPEKNREQIIKGILQITLPIAADENNYALQQAAIQGGGTVSMHNARVSAQAIGAWTAARTRDREGKRVPTPYEEATGIADDGIMRFNDGDGSTFWGMLTRVSDNVSKNPWNRTSVMEAVHYEKSDAKVRQYTQPIDKNSEERGWNDTMKSKANARADELLKRMGLSRYGERERLEVDYLVRQFVGRPGAAQGQDDFVDEISANDYIEIVDAMLANVKRYMHPLHGAAVPLEHSAFWRKVFDAQKNRAKSDQWSPMDRIDGKKRVAADDWNAWVAALMGQMTDSNEDFHAMFRVDLDGFFHTYQGVAAGFEQMAVSTDKTLAIKLLDPDTQRFYSSLDPSTRAVLKDPIILDNMVMHWDTLVGNTPSYDSRQARQMPTSTLSEQWSRQKKWLAKEKITPQKQSSIKSYVQKGVYYQESSRKTNVFFRNLINLSLSVRLLNPALYASAWMEVPMRNMFEHFTNLATGNHIGLGGKLLSGVDLEIGDLKITSQFTPKQVEVLQALAAELGESNQFLGELIGEMTYRNLAVGQEGSRGLTAGLEKLASFAARATSDPTWGMKNSSVGRRYIEAAWEYISQTNSSMTPEQFVKQLKEDPLWLKKNLPMAHRMGVNRVAQVRSTRPTVASKAIMSPIDVMTSSESRVLNGTGHLLKIPFLFTRFNMNMLMTFTGLNSLDQAAAMFFDARRVSLNPRRALSLMTEGENRSSFVERMHDLAHKDTYDDKPVRQMDFQDVIEGIDLSRSFVRGMMTQTGLMAAGMMAASAALGGEDEEARRRKRLASLYNFAYYEDPRDASNDFRWKDAIFLDNVPVLNNIYKDETGHSAVVPHWIIRQFTSPVLGMMRFFETGDTKELAAGFWDAAAAIPTSVVRLWRETEMTANLVQQAAVEGGESMVPEKNAAMTQYLINTVGIYEKALVESMFINGMRSALDIDRNPYLLPKMDETGELIRTSQGYPEQTDALMAYRADDGTLGTGTANRTGTDAFLHQYAENNGTASMLLSLIGGGDTSYWRRNMAPREQTVRGDALGEEEATRLVLSAFHGLGDQQVFTKDEVVNMLKTQYSEADIWWDLPTLESQADEIIAAMEPSGALSLMDDTGRELVTTEGATGIYRSLWKEGLKFGDSSLLGVAIDKETRQAVAQNLKDEVIQEGVDFGLTETQARWRWRRFWWGDDTDPGSPGLRSIIYSDQIPLNPDTEYTQLNVTWAIGPDGKYWATPFKRTSVAQALGLPIPHTVAETIPGVTTLDERGNVVDLVRGINTGLAAIAPKPVEIEIEPDDSVAEDDGSDGKTYSRNGGSYGGGYGGSYGGSYGPSFMRMYALPNGTGARKNGIPMINVNTPYIRRSNIRRERITSQRGRLKQWQ